MTEQEVVTTIDAALARIASYAEQDLYQSRSIQRQLLWCRGRLTGGCTEPAPGPLSMGLIATREFDMYGQEPDLADMINQVQRYMEDSAPP